MLAIGRALMAKPRLLLLDEPSLGLAPMLVREIFRVIKALNEEAGITVLLVEQDANMALSLSQHAYVLETGAVALHDSAENLRRNEEVRRVYLGY
jgi:branched-chain amino acid transport system ATP-binding protein